jgi:hypothetical protein
MPPHRLLASVERCPIHKIRAQAGDSPIVAGAIVAGAIGSGRGSSPAAERDDPQPGLGWRRIPLSRPFPRKDTTSRSSPINIAGPMA